MAMLLLALSAMTANDVAASNVAELALGVSIDVPQLIGSSAALHRASTDKISSIADHSSESSVVKIGAPQYLPLLYFRQAPKLTLHAMCFL